METTLARTKMTKSLLSTFKLLAFCAVLLLTATHMKAQSKWDKKGEKIIEKSEADYKKGDYLTAEIRASRYLKKMRKQGNMSSQYYTYVSLLNTRYLQGLGRLMEVRDSLENGVFYFNMFLSPDSSFFTPSLVAIGESYLETGNYVKANQYLKRVEENIEERLNNATPLTLSDTLIKRARKNRAFYLSDPINNTDSILYNHIKKLKLRIEMQLGFFNEDSGDVEPLIVYQNKLAQRTFPNVDTTAKKPTIKISKKEFKKRNVDLAALYVLKADFHRLSGNYQKAATLYYDNGIAFKKSVSKKSLPYTQNNYGKTAMAESDGRLEKPYKYYEKIKRQIIKSGQISNYHKFYNEVTEKAIESYLMEDKNKKARNLYLKYKLDNQHKYSPRSVYYLRAIMLENEYTSKKTRYKKAVKKENKLKEGIEQVVPYDNLAHLQFNDHFYNFYSKNNRVEEARIERETNEWLAGLNMSTDAPYYSAEKIKLAEFNILNQDKFADAKSVFDKHFDGVFRKQFHSHHPLYSEFLKSFSLLKTYTDEYDAAYLLAGERLRISNEKYGPESEQYALALIQLSEINILKGEYDQAESQLEVASKIINNNSSKKSMAYYTSLKNLADIYMINGKYEEAKDTYKKAFKLLKKSGEGGEMDIKSSEDMAELYMTTGRYKDAENIILQSINANESKFGENHFKLVKPLNLYAQLYLILGEYIEAEKRANRAIDIAEKSLGDTSVAYMDNLMLLGNVYVKMGNYDDAKKIYKDALSLIRKKFGEENIREADILKSLADANFRSDDANLETINGYLDHAKDIVITSFNPAHPDYGALLEYQGQVFMLFEKYPEADLMLKDAQFIWLNKFGKNHINTARNEMLVGDLKYLQQKYEEAEKSYEEAAQSYKSLFNDLHPGYLEAKSKQAKSYYAAGKLMKAKSVYDETTESYLGYLKDYFPALSESEKGKYWNSIKRDFEIYNSLALATYEKNNKALRNVYNFKLSTKAVLQSSSTKLKSRIVNSNDGDLIYRFDQYNDKKDMLTKGLAMSPEEREVNGIEMSKLSKQINALEKQLSEESEDFAGAFDSEQYNWKDVKKSLKENEYAIEIIRFRHFDKQFIDSVLYAALILNKKSKGPKLVLLNNGSELEKKYFKGYRNSIKYKVNKDKYSYPNFWKAIDEEIEDGAKVFVSADGVFNQLNIETLMDENGKYIIEKNEIYNLSNSKDLVIARREDFIETYDKSTAMLMGNPSFAASGTDIDLGNKVSSIEALPGAEEEIKKVAKLLDGNQWQTQVKVQGEATEQALKKMNSPRVCHIATHGFFMEESNEDDKKSQITGDFADNPLLRSGLLFTGAGELLAKNNIYDFNKKDGILTAYEAMNLNLDHTELVVLSACETGVGEIKSGEGVYGLQRSFIVAGAQNVIMTLFKVNDEVTQELMSDFYTQWLATGDKRAAFQSAKLKIKEKYQKPVYWGSFVLIGM